MTIAQDPAGLDDADALIVPGVGAAAPAMARLRDAGLVEPIRAWIAADRPFLGICLGLQLLFEGSDEDGAETLGVLAGRSVRLTDAPTLPHIGWNQVERTPRPSAVRRHRRRRRRSTSSTRTSAPPARRRGRAGHDRARLARSCRRSRRGRLAGVQFHPERSGDDGLRLLANFRSLRRGGPRDRGTPRSRV